MKKSIALSALLVPSAIAAAGLPRHKVDVTTYSISLRSIRNPMRIVLLSDLHNEDYGPGMKRLTDLVREQKPDLILMPGDFAQRKEDDKCMELMYALPSIAPCYYSSGNHEEFSWDASALKQRISSSGVTVLDNQESTITLCGNRLEIVGLRCLVHDRKYDSSQINALFHEDACRILLCHKPQDIELFQKIDCNLIVSGHAHGGQWCIPGTKQGILAPDQGLFPKYTYGVHHLKEEEYLVISRGLVRSYRWIPRLYNNPEIVVIDLNHKEETHAE